MKSTRVLIGIISLLIFVNCSPSDNDLENENIISIGEKSYPVKELNVYSTVYNHFGFNAHIFTIWTSGIQPVFDSNSNSNFSGDHRLNGEGHILNFSIHSEYSDIDHFEYNISSVFSTNNSCFALTRSPYSFDINLEEYPDNLAVVLKSGKVKVIFDKGIYKIELTGVDNKGRTIEVKYTGKGNDNNLDFRGIGAS